MSEEVTKEDILNITGSMFDTMLDYADNSHNEIEALKKEKENLIKYLEDKIKEPVSYNLLYDGKQQAYQDILERVKSGKYE